MYTTKDGKFQFETRNGVLVVLGDDVGGVLSLASQPKLEKAINSLLKDAVINSGTVAEVVANAGQGPLNMDAVADAFRREEKAARKSFHPDKLKVGDWVCFYHRPYQHTCTIEITKINAKSVSGVEVWHSYKPGTPWRVHKETEGLKMAERRLKPE